MKYNVNLYDRNDNLIYNVVIEANSEEQAMELAWDKFIMGGYTEATLIDDKEKEIR